jgi:hypothetical protein
MAYGGGGDSGAAEQRALEIQRQSKIAQGMANIDEQFGRFDDEFYNRRAGEVEQYHLPELNRQATETRNSLAYSLARSGLTRSGVAEDKYGCLDREKATQERNVPGRRARTSCGRTWKGNGRRWLIRCKPAQIPTWRRKRPPGRRRRTRRPRVYSPSAISLKVGAGTTSTTRWRGLTIRMSPRCSPRGADNRSRAVNV